MQITCPHCSTPQEIDGAFAGHMTACYRCNGQFILPVPQASFHAPAEPPVSDGFGNWKPTGGMTRRDPAVAALLSALWTGLGNIYNGDTTKGVLLAVVQAGLLAFGLFLCITIPLCIILWAWGIFDAQSQAHEINRRLRL